MAAVYWLVLFVVFLIIELPSAALTTIWFAAGALVAFVASMLDANVYVQWFLFIAVSTVLLALTRPLAKKYLYNRKEKTNTDLLIGKETIVCETINNLNDTGKVMLNGIEWTARTKDPDDILKSGSKVKVIRIEGVTAIVEKVHA